MMARTRKFLALSPFERRLLLGAWVVVAFVRAGLFLLPFRVMRAFQRTVVRRVLDRRRRQAVVAPDGLDEKVAWALDAACRRIPGQSTCLRRAMAASILYGFCGAQVDLRIGVARGEDKSIAAHAWVERGGKVVVGDLNDLRDFSTFPPM